jgi:hypothetical protein
MRKLISTSAMLLLAASLSAQQPSGGEHHPAQTMDAKDCPMHAEHMKESDNHLAEVNRRGAEAMGFSQEATVHKFSLAPDGGAIQVTTRDPDDKQTRAQVQSHMQEIARRFAAADFAQPQHTHGVVPPGVKQMQALRGKLRYSYDALPTGARVRITTSDPVALKAVHEFLRFQISDHSTGDPADVQ